MNEIREIKIEVCLSIFVAGGCLRELNPQCRNWSFKYQKQTVRMVLIYWYSILWDFEDIDTFILQFIYWFFKRFQTEYYGTRSKFKQGTANFKYIKIQWVVGVVIIAASKRFTN